MMKRSSPNLTTNFQDLVAKVKNLVALAPVLGAISRPECIWQVGNLGIWRGEVGEEGEGGEGGGGKDGMNRVGDK